MQVTVTGRHIDITPSLKEYVAKRVSRVEKYLPISSDAHIVLSVEKYRHHAEVSLRANGAVIHSREITENMYSAIDGVMDKIEHQIKKHKEKIKGRKRHGNTELIS